MTRPLGYYAWGVDIGPETDVTTVAVGNCVWVTDIVVPPAEPRHEGIAAMMARLTPPADRVPVER